MDRFVADVRVVAGDAFGRRGLVVSVEVDGLLGAGDGENGCALSTPATPTQTRGRPMSDLGALAWGLARRRR